MICDKCIHKEVCKLYNPKSNLVGCIFYYSFPERNDEVKLKVIDMRGDENGS